MNENDNLSYILKYAQLDQIKGLLFCMDGLSCSDRKMVEIINSHGGFDKYFDAIKARHVNFLAEERKQLL